MSTTLNLRIHSVKCVDETNGSFAEKFGNDEISLGGFTVDAQANTRKIEAFNVGSNFDDGETVRFNPPRTFASFNISNLNSPANFTVGLLLIERDNGGTSEALKKIADTVIAEIAKRKSAALVGSNGGTATAVAAAIPVALIWSLVKPIIFSYVKEKIMGFINDDFFPLQDAVVTIINSNHTFNGRKTSPISMVEFRGNEGVYTLIYDWELR